MKANLKNSVVSVTLRDTRVGLHIPSGHSTLSHRKGAIGQWSQWIGGAALMLALAGPFAPATTSAVINDDPWGEEVIEVEGTAPGSPTAPWVPGGYTGGSSGSPSGPSGGDGGASGGGSVPSGDSTYSTKGAQKVAAERKACLDLGGVWGNATFKDLETNVAYAGYSCRQKFSNGLYIWFYFDSEGNYHYQCQGDLDVQTCEKP